MSLDGLRPRLPELPEGDVWLSNDAQERLVLISFGDELPDIRDVVDFVGAEPTLAEEFDVE